MRTKKFIGITLTLTGCLLVILAIGAPYIGLDKDDGWGPARLFLLSTGVFLALIPYSRRVAIWAIGAAYAFMIRYMPGFSSVVENLKSRIAQYDDKPISAKYSSLHPARRAFWINAQIGFVFTFSVVIFTFLISVGRWTTWLDTTEDFHLLAEGFRQGNTYLALEPDPALLAIDDPYLYENRRDVQQLWDASLYEGKYYLYWGPVPAFVTLILESFVNTPIKDPHLVWLFSVAAIFVCLQILRQFWLYEFNTLPAWLILPPAIAVSLSNPLPWIMARPAVYEAAIVAGQLFFLMGIYSMLILGRKVKDISWTLAIPGCFLALALASRFTLMPAAILILSGFLIRLILSTRKSTGIQRKFHGLQAIIVFSPILLSLVMLGLYNYVRFDSMLESGHRYQLTLGMLSGNYASSFSSQNILSNIYNYFINPLRRIETFPFVKPLWGSYSVPILRATASGRYHAEQITGVVISTPFTLFSVLPLLVSLRAIWENLDELRISHVVKLNIFRAEWGWLYISLCGSVIISVLPLLIFSYCTMRYLLDFLPTMLILSAIGYAYSINTICKGRICKKALIWIGIVTSSYSVIIGILLGVTGYFAYFEHVNPDLFERISRFLSF